MFCCHLQPSLKVRKVGVQQANHWFRLPDHLGEIWDWKWVNNVLSFSSSSPKCLPKTFSWCLKWLLYNSFSFWRQTKQASDLRTHILKLDVLERTKTSYTLSITCTHIIWNPQMFISENVCRQTAMVFPGIGSWWQQVQQDRPEAFPGQIKYTVYICFGMFWYSGVSCQLDVSRQTPMEGMQDDPNETPKHSLLAPMDAKVQWLYSELP